MLTLNQIPTDLYEVLEEDEIHYTGSLAFDVAMIQNDLFEYGTIRWNHRIITAKAHQLGYQGIIELLCGLNETQVKEFRVNETKNQRISEMMATAKEFGYTITKTI